LYKIKTYKFSFSVAVGPQEGDETVAVGHPGVLQDVVERNSLLRIRMQHLAQQVFAVFTDFLEKRVAEVELALNGVLEYFFRDLAVEW
jgi:hypothetical protein